MREAIKKLKNCFWGEYLIGTIIFEVITAILLGISIGSINELSNAKSEAAELYQCEEVLFCFNADETSAKPLGYFIEARDYAPNGEMTRKFERNEKAREWFELEEKSEITTAITIPFGTFSGVVLMIMLYLLIDGIFFIRSMKKREETSN